MPIYEYECSKCGGKLEALQKMSDPPLARHKGCGGKLTKLLSAPGIQFKGSGWYVTDYARKGNGGSSDSGGESKTAPKNESKTEPKKPPSSSD